MDKGEVHHIEFLDGVTDANQQAVDQCFKSKLANSGFYCIYVDLVSLDMYGLFIPLYCMYPIGYTVPTIQSVCLRVSLLRTGQGAL